MKLTILGNNGPYPSAGSACSSYLLDSDSGKTHLLIDCGAGALAALPQRLSWDALDAILLSHLHFDHMSDILPMQYALQFHPRNPLPVYAPETPAPMRALLCAPCYELHPMKDCAIGEFKISFFAVRHPVETYAMRIVCDGRCMVYTGDTNEVDGLAAFAEGADLLLADAGLSAQHWSAGAPHLSAAGCAKLAAQANCARLLLTHLNPRYTAAQLEAEARLLRPDAAFTSIGASYAV